MKANELRIGNWVMDRGGKQWQIYEWEYHDKVAAEPPIFGVDEVFGKMIAHPFTEDIDYLQPIPLTEEWLVMFGFEKKPISYSISITCFQKLELKELGIDLNQGLFIRQGDLKQKRADDDLVSIWNFDKQGAIHVHQLQNLYFALCGEELKLNDQ